MLSDEEKIHAIKVWYSTKSLTKVQRSFRKRPGYHAKNLPRFSPLQWIVNKFEQHGTVQDRRRGSELSIKEYEVKNVQRLYKNTQSLSLCSASRRLNMTRQNVSKILRLKLLKKAYKARIRMHLTERQRKTRIEASQELLRQKRILPHVWFTDESWFYSDGIAQKKNQYFWTFNKDAVKPVESQLVPIKVMVWGSS